MALPSNNNNNITYFAETDYRNARKKFGIKAADRTRHMYVIGKTGMGKSTLLENMAIQDIRDGNGVGFIDPHGGTAEKLLEYVPEERIKDIVYFAPFDTDYPMSFNIMEDVGYDKRHLVVSGLMGVFKKIWQDAWSARMEYILSNTLFALLEYPDATLLGVNRMYVDKEYRKKVVDNITDPSVKSFWVDEYAKYTDRYTQEATPAIQNKIGQFTSNPLVRNIVGQPHSAFDIRKLMDEKKILIMNLSKGRVGDQNATLLGSMLVTKIYLAAMSRADAPEEEMSRLPNFYFFVDEFQSFANESFADILSEARKYKLNLTIAHQYVEQMPEEVRAAVFGNVGTMVTFRIGAFDAEIFEREFAPKFTKDDMVSLGFAQVYLKLMIDGVSSAPFSATTLPPIGLPESSYKNEVIAYTREHYAKPRAEVEEKILAWHTHEKHVEPDKKSSQRVAHPVADDSTNSARPPRTPERHLPRDEPPVQKTVTEATPRPSEPIGNKQHTDMSVAPARVGAAFSETARQRAWAPVAPASSASSGGARTEASVPSRVSPSTSVGASVVETAPPRRVLPRAPSAVPRPVVQKRFSAQGRRVAPLSPSAAPRQAQADTARPVSLSALSSRGRTMIGKSTKEDEKSATRPHLDELRKTLSGIMNTNHDTQTKISASTETIAETPPVADAPVILPRRKKISARKGVAGAGELPRKDNIPESPIGNTNEVPEDVLKKILSEK
ncbi:MAG: hypothetical protein COW88_03570 [Candidatus Lloydbacteria bacterium CG22_combo_CG10-13_8_21_14_all_47_15]|uniref:Type IV secretion system coupling protein TraD DNA-binding domain-containing protein n=1 Tax=Candidatus Lloydbacteria bacterium CG22_combo_CG10-13_8_21_14_all_47_15 TaxID=1974635 RepID=A0A2H0CST8_9BACT|nr:MAG: hypothetical protein COW88_03570 [Candidatus Lloydbacteria bacterium CG22_combo_CG10-13_8_21_14_all_47_15]